MKIIFTKQYHNYNIGQVITVNREKATSLISQGVAEFFVQTVKTKFGDTKALQYNN